mmetsp:Transcript_69534/g.226492  ORF Transcript_69534/g.226492 Transcript_69534/m.226492 type:complete len:235 (-) Transcript_69534:374-1078(-)
MPLFLPIPVRRSGGVVLPEVEPEEEPEKTDDLTWRQVVQRIAAAISAAAEESDEEDLPETEAPQLAWQQFGRRVAAGFAAEAEVDADDDDWNEERLGPIPDVRPWQDVGRRLAQVFASATVDENESDWEPRPEVEVPADEAKYSFCSSPAISTTSEKVPSTTPGNAVLSESSMSDDSDIDSDSDEHSRLVDAAVPGCRTRSPPYEALLGITMVTARAHLRNDDCSADGCCPVAA